MSISIEQGIVMGIYIAYTVVAGIYISQTSVVMGIYISYIIVAGIYIPWTALVSIYISYTLIARKHISYIVETHLGLCPWAFAADTSTQRECQSGDSNRSYRISKFSGQNQVIAGSSSWMYTAG